MSWARPFHRENEPEPGSLIPPVDSKDSQLLRYAVRWYQSLKIPTPGDDARLFKSLDSAAVGIAVSIPLGSEDAVNMLCDQIEFLASSPKLHRLLDALGMYYQPRNTGAVPALLHISALHVAIPGMDAAVGSALQKIGTRSVLPAMAELLDSHDPKAQIRAASFFANFAMFADEHGNIPGGVVPGPLASAATAANTPRQDSGESPSKYAQFWKVWWSLHRAEPGFAMK